MAKRIKTSIISYNLSGSDGIINLYDNITIKYQYCDKEVVVDGLSGSYARNLFLFSGSSIDRMVEAISEAFKLDTLSIGSIWSKSGTSMEKIIERN